MGNSHSQGENDPAARCPVPHGAPGVPGQATAPARDSATTIARQSAPGLPSACPVDHGKGAGGVAAGAPVPAAAPSPGLPASCPVDHGKSGAARGGGGRARGTVYNVYAQPIDPTNQMPVTANQLPAPGQQKPLDTVRVNSTIPKGGTEGTWQYPSPQMFWNSLVRKGKVNDATEDDMGVVVSIHNEMNERTWRELLAWELRHASEHLDGEPSLRRFKGMPYTLSPKARVKSWFGYGFPFDRHDWYVDRAGVERRYIIDYYYNPDPTLAPPEAAADPAGGAPPAPAPLPVRYTSNIHVDVRPAVDDVAAALDRVTRFPARALAALRRPRFRAEGIDPATAPKEAAALAMLHSSATLGGADAAAAAAASPADGGGVVGGSVFAAVDARCKPHLDALRAAGDDEDARRRAYVGLSYCSGRVACPAEASAFMAVVEAGGGGDDEAAAFEAMNRCVVARMGRERAERGAAAAAAAAVVVPGGGATAPAAGAGLR